MILPADKGNVTVVMDQSEYVGKMDSLLEDSAYRVPKRDPSNKFETTIAEQVRELRRKDYISDQQKRFITPLSFAPPLIYGLPKDHKEGLPLIPIVSTIGCPMYDLSRN